MHSLYAMLGVAAVCAGCASNQPATSMTFGAAAQSSAQSSPQSSAQSSVQVSSLSPAEGAPSMKPDATPHASVAAPAAPAASGTMPTTPDPSAAVANASTSTAFSTRHAYYAPTRFADLPGWSTDNLGNSWDAFKRSCAVLGSRAGWSAPCIASRSVDARNVAAIRIFFETYFNAYQIRNTDKSGEGTLTGYYEPLLNGSQQYGGAFLYPLYGTPDDMLYLDARRLPERARGAVSAARIEGRTVVPVTDSAAGGIKGVYALDLRDSVPDIRDKKIRLRLDHERIVPYYTRAEIERGALKAPILAYVDDPAMLYSMQVQGAGKVRMPDGTVRRFAYAEQNGRPFVPPVARTGGGSGQRITVRGMDVEIDVVDETSTGATSTADAQTPGDATGDVTSTSARAQDDDEPVSPLLRGFKLAAATPQSGGAVTPAIGAAASKPGHAATGAAKAAATGPATASTASASVKRVFAISDPSYVFFRRIPDSPDGPLGALGVPLSAGRSVAVDPRTTPLGAPVFVSTQDDPQTPGAIDRLMMAQDSGGAIQGAVRADYFYGFGQNAQAQASRTKERIRMWVLLPKGLHIAAQEATLKTRGGAPAVSNADCLVSDPELCVDDAP
ncbi:Membrane-bound lytic murein transglycosylase [Paraburkholderia piptadeniae]|uniref:peptidoglycan lytic exotransglycosylase n=1 Tax=Paraburkholderia piptadeniae TaxID=1701573 RepID=A0A1N7RKV8_9BURK|nr:MltA domain-containing protein [Paraburkholderia piptadeniae]SIT35741.1 Membrane-bound lytic murein transglycosylase [Paraburkholderia piptadeniae]